MTNKLKETDRRTLPLLELLTEQKTLFHEAHLGRAVAGEHPLSGLLDTLHVLLHRGQDLAAQVPAPARVVLSPASSELRGSKWIATVHFTNLFSMLFC